jgi:hypothetical protein
MKAILSLIVLCSTVAFSLNAQVIPYQELPSPESKPGIDLVLEYESPRDKIVVRDGKLTHISKTYHYDENRPYNANPVGMSSRAISESVPLNGRQLTALKNQIQSSGILSLPGSTFGAPQGERSYDFILRIVVDGQQKSVIFRSNPSYASPPMEFERMKEYIWRLVAEAER